MIDVWLLFNLVIPFIEVSTRHNCFQTTDKNFVQVLMQTYIEYLRSKLEEKKEMNHHGKSVVVETAGKTIAVSPITPVE